MIVVQEDFGDLEKALGAHWWAPNQLLRFQKLVVWTDDKWKGVTVCLLWWGVAKTNSALQEYLELASSFIMKMWCHSPKYGKNSRTCMALLVSVLVWTKWLMCFANAYRTICTCLWFLCIYTYNTYIYIFTFVYRSPLEGCFSTHVIKSLPSVKCM